MNRTLLRQVRRILLPEHLSAREERAFLTRVFARHWAEKASGKTQEETSRTLEPFLPEEIPVSARAQRQLNALLQHTAIGHEGDQNAFTPAILALVCEQTDDNRKGKGVFYTPEQTAALLSQKTLDGWLNSNGFNTPDNNCKKMAALDAPAICDPAAGAGGLLIPFWLELEKRFPALPAARSGELLINLSRYFYAADVDGFALKTLRLRAALTVYERGLVPPADLFPNLLEGDALSGGQTSVWQQAFPAVFARGGFDVVISNPPYVGQKNHKAVFEKLRKNPRWRARLAPKGDLLYLFFHLALDILKPGGTGGFLTTAYFTQAASAAGLRKRLEKESAFLYLSEFHGSRLFADAQGQHNLRCVFQKTENKNSLCKREFGEEQDAVPQTALYSGPDRFLITRPEDDVLTSLLRKMAGAPLTLKDAAHISNGLMTGCDKISAAHLSRHRLPGVQKGEGVFVLSQAEKDALRLSPAELKKLKPFFKNSDISSYTANTVPKYWLIDFFYPNDRDLDVTRYPGLLAHLSRFKPVLLARKQNNNGIDKQLKKGVYWFASVRRKLDFDAEKLVVPHRARANTFAFAPGPWYASSDVYFISAPKPGFSLWYLLALLNSAPYYAWLYYHGKRKGNLLELYSQPLSGLPLPPATAEQQAELEKLAQEIYRAKRNNPAKDTQRQETQINRWVGELFGFTPQELARVEKLRPA